MSRRGCRGAGDVADVRDCDCDASGGRGRGAASGAWSVGRRPRFRRRGQLRTGWCGARAARSLVARWRGRLRSREWRRPERLRARHRPSERVWPPVQPSNAARHAGRSGSETVVLRRDVERRRLRTAVGCRSSQGASADSPRQRQAGQRDHDADERRCERDGDRRHQQSGDQSDCALVGACGPVPRAFFAPTSTPRISAGWVQSAIGLSVGCASVSGFNGRCWRTPRPSSRARPRIKTSTVMCA